jgi:hypothetical protein
MASNKKLPPFVFKGNTSFWASFAPAVVDNYMLRHLLGRYGHCRYDFSGTASTFSQEHFAHGAAKLMSFDHVIVVGQVRGCTGAAAINWHSREAVEAHQ